MPKTRRIKSLNVGESIPANHGYCRRCMHIKLAVEFFSAIDLELDKNGLMSVCKSCIDEMYGLILNSENGSVQKTILKLCKTLNIRYEESAITAAMRQIETNKSDPTKVMGLYKAKLKVILRENPTDNFVDLTYQDSPNIILNQEIINDEDFEDARDLKSFWNTDNKEDIEFLENEFSGFKKTHKADTYAEITLLKEVCYKLLDMSKDRKGGKSTDSSLKQLMEVMKNLAISPNMTNVAGGGKSLDAFGLWIKDIENLTPAEWIEDKSIYKDVDDIEAYGEKFITSPLRAFVTNSREFSIDDSEVSDDEVEPEPVIEG